MWGGDEENVDRKKGWSRVDQEGGKEGKKEVWRREVNGWGKLWSYRLGSSPCPVPGKPMALAVLPLRSVEGKPARGRGPGSRRTEGTLSALGRARGRRGVEVLE